MRAFVAIAILSIVVAAPLAAQDPPSIVIQNVVVVDVTDGSLLDNRTVLVEGNRIAAVGAVDKVGVPDDAEVVDGAGGFLIPGLWDMHVHSAANVSWHFPLFVAYGVTGVRNMHTTVDTALALTTDIQRRLAEGKLLGPRFLANGPIMDGEPPVWPGTVVVNTATEGRAAVDSLAHGGADFIKVYDHLSREAYFAIADQARRRGFPMVGHVPYRVRPEEAAEVGQRTDEHMLGLQWGCSVRADSLRAERRRSDSWNLSFFEGLLAEFRVERALYDTRSPFLCTSTLEAYRKNGMAVVPNLVIHHNNNHADQVLRDTVHTRFIPRAMRSQWEQRAGGPITELMRPTWEARKDNVRLMSEADVLILAGTDLGNPMLIPGLSLHQELELLFQAGLTSLEALQTATLNPAQFFGRTDELGTVTEGKLADLVLLEANPLEDITNTRRIRAVVADGRLYRRSDLDRLLAEVEASAEQVNKQE